MKVSFDFDGTLALPNVTEFAKELINEGIEVWIVTTRYDQRCESLNPNYFKLHAPHCWEEVFEKADKIGIKRENIFFTCYEWKGLAFDFKDFIFHLDDNYQEEYDIKGKTNFVLVKKGWKKKCKLLLNIKEMKKALDAL